MKIKYRDYLQIGELEQRELYYDEISKQFYISKYKVGEDSRRRINLLLPSISPFIMMLLFRTIDQQGYRASLLVLLASYGLSYLIFRIASQNFFTADLEVLPYNLGQDKLEQHLTSLSKSVYLPVIFLLVLSLFFWFFSWLYLINGQSINLFMIVSTTLLILLLSHMKPVKRIKVLRELLKK